MCLQVCALVRVRLHGALALLGVQHAGAGLSPPQHSRAAVLPTAPHGARDGGRRAPHNRPICHGNGARRKHSSTDGRRVSRERRSSESCAIPGSSSARSSLSLIHNSFRDREVDVQYLCFTQTQTVQIPANSVPHYCIELETCMTNNVKTPTVIPRVNKICSTKE